jgi:hypothetical protein
MPDQYSLMTALYADPLNIEGTTMASAGGVKNGFSCRRLKPPILPKPQKLFSQFMVAGSRDE